MGILFVLLMLLFFLGILFYFLIFPIWMIVDCAISERKSSSKVAWIIALLLTWTLGALVYGLFASVKRAVKILSGAGFVFAIGFIVAAVMVVNWSKTITLQQIEMKVSNFQQINVTALSQTEADEFKTSVDKFRDDLKHFSLLKSRAEVNDLEKGLVLGGMLSDNMITHEEFEDWQKIYSNSLSKAAFQDLERKYKFLMK